MTNPSMMEQVREFHRKFNFSINRPFTQDEILAKRMALLDEEYREFRDAVAQGNKQAMLKELCDLLYVACGFGVCYGLPVESGFTRVHASNMSKAPSATQDGKAIKGPDYVPARLDDLLENPTSRDAA